MISVAVDLGTTVVSFSAFDGARRIARADLRNPQKIAGLDVASRIAAASASAGRAFELQRLLSSALVQRVASALHACAMRASEISMWCFSGNTAMEGIFAGKDVSSLARAPFSAPWSGVLRMKAADLGLPCAPGAPAVFMPPLASFAGGDTASAILAAERGGIRRPYALLDLGTNAEIVYAAPGGETFVASAAAGPAFEGAGASCGVPAFRGAIDRVELNAGVFRCHVVGDPPGTWTTAGGGAWVNNRNKARGICASGIIDVLAEAVRAGILKEDGSMDASKIVLRDGVYVTREDIRAFQTAKAAVCAAMETVFAEADVQDGKARALPLVLAGSMGRRILRRNAEKLGIWPSGMAAVPIGNASLAGAELYIGAPEECELRLSRIAASVRHVNLAESPLFQSLFIERMQLRRF